MKPEGEVYVDLGKGEKEGKLDKEKDDKKKENNSIEMIRQISSSGYLRKRLPHELLALQSKTETSGEFQQNTKEDLTKHNVRKIQLDQIAKAKLQGYEGDPCDECGNFTLVRNGTCMKCNTCGSTSGCS